MWYEKLIRIQNSTLTRLNIAVVHIQRKDYEKASSLLLEIDPLDLEQRAYLYYGTWAEFYTERTEYSKALTSLEEAIKLVHNEAEKNYLTKKKEALVKLMKDH